MEYTSLTPADIAGLEGLDDWGVDDTTLRAAFRSPNYLAAADLIRAIAQIAEDAAHHPDLELRYPGVVHVALTTHATGGLTTLDVDVARLVTEAATRVGAAAEA
jgi:4a-hydroxytetrahydrobiopterin dehydratase